jgi:hypothetical protein
MDLLLLENYNDLNLPDGNITYLAYIIKPFYKVIIRKH